MTPEEVLPDALLERIEQLYPGYPETNPVVVSSDQTASHRFAAATSCTSSAFAPA